AARPPRRTPAPHPRPRRTRRSTTACAAEGPSRRRSRRAARRTPRTAAPGPLPVAAAPWRGTGTTAPTAVALGGRRACRAGRRSTARMTNRACSLPRCERRSATRPRTGELPQAHHFADVWPPPPARESPRGDALPGGSRALRRSDLAGLLQRRAARARDQTGHHVGVDVGVGTPVLDVAALVDLDLPRDPHR